MGVQFQQLSYLHALWGVTALGLLCLYGAVRRRRALERFAAAHLLGHLVPERSRPREALKAGLLLTALAAIVLGLTDPRWGVSYEDVQQRGMDIVFCLDVSRSMLAGDVRPNRLERAKQYIRDVLEECAGDRVALVTFAGEPVLKCPLTVNYGGFRMVLDEVTTRSSPRGGTLIGDAIRAAVDAFVDEIKGYKAVVLFTDGEDQESFPVEAAAKAFSERGIRVYTVGLGDEVEGQRIPLPDAGPGRYLVHEGQEVWSKMNPQTLREIALRGGGVYVPARTTLVDMAQVYRSTIASADQREFESARLVRHHERYAWFAGAALALLAVEGLVSPRRAAPAGEAVEGSG